MHYDFHADLRDGQQAENEVAQLLATRFGVAIEQIERSASKGFDLRIVPLNRTFEVKNDLLAERTGNIAIEYECRGRASGLAATTADYWVYKFSGNYCLIETVRLNQELFIDNNFWKKVSGGDPGSSTRMFLVKVAIFKTWGVPL